MKANKKAERQETAPGEEAITTQEAQETAEAAEAQPQEQTEEQTRSDSQPSEMEQLQAENAEMKDKYLRLAAEFDNYRKRTLKEKADLLLNGGARVIESVLPVIDDLERALQNMEKATDVEAVKEGVQLVYHKFVQILAQNGVKPIETTGAPMNTDYHEAIAVIPAPDEAQKGLVIDCVQTGYTLNDKVIRHAKVVVAQ